MNTFTRAAHVVSTRGNKGSVVCKAADALPFLLCEGQTVYFVPPTLRGPRQAQVEQVKEIKPGSWEVQFSELASLEQAEQLLGSYCLVSSRQIPHIPAYDNPSLLVGYTVYDAVFGKVGELMEVQAERMQVLLVVAGQHGQVLIPFVDEFIERIEEDERAIYVSIPETLLTLNAPELNGGVFE